jgi:Cof subfamily protein (haloacid dehalogenase superfamily)
MATNRFDVVALDLDGTTVRSDGTIGARTTAALRRIEELGVTVIAVTGRPPRWMPPVAEAFGGSGLAICANGAVVIDLADLRVIEERLLPAEVVRLLMTELSAAMPELGYAVELAGDRGFLFETGYRPKSTTETSLRVADGELPDEPVRKLLARHGSVSADELLAAASAAVGADVATLTHSSSDGLLEISALGVSKATTLASVCAGRGIEPAAVIAFGDMPNDIPMLAWAGHGVAVANAHPDVLAVADQVCGSNDAEGVAVLLETLWP